MMGKKSETPVIKAGLQRERYLQALRKLEADVKAANEFKSQIGILSQKLGTELTSLTEVESYLESTTGFPNLEMASDAMNVKADYLRLKSLSRPSIEPELISENENGRIELSPDSLDILKAKFTPEVAPEFQSTAQKMLAFKGFYDGLSHQEKLAFVQFNRTSLQVKLDSLTYVHR